jgi:hypothetical protein
MVLKYSRSSLERSRDALRAALHEFAWGPAPAKRERKARAPADSDSWGPRMPWAKEYFEVEPRSLTGSPLGGL